MVENGHAKPMFPQQINGRSHVLRFGVVADAGGDADGGVVALRMRRRGFEDIERDGGAVGSTGHAPMTVLGQLTAEPTLQRVNESLEVSIFAPKLRRLVNLIQDGTQLDERVGEGGKSVSYQRNLTFTEGIE